MTQTEKRRKIFREAVEGKLMLETLKKGENILDTSENKEIIETRLMQLLHFRLYAKMYEFAFGDWGTEGIEQTYIEVANEALELHNLLNHNVFNELLCSLLRILSEHSGENPVLIHTRRTEELSRLWIDAGLISSNNKPI